jgi:hypothetical protein
MTLLQLQRLLVTTTGGIIQRVPCTAAIFWSIVRPHLISNHSWLIHQNSLVAAEIPSSKTGSCWEISLNLADVVSLSYSKGMFNIPWNLTTWGRRLYFPPKEGVTRIFVALRNPSPSAGFEPANLGSDGKHANHYTTEDNAEVRPMCHQKNEKMITAFSRHCFLITGGRKEIMKHSRVFQKVTLLYTPHPCFLSVHIRLFYDAILSVPVQMAVRYKA